MGKPIFLDEISGWQKYFKAEFLVVLTKTLVEKFDCSYPSKAFVWSNWIVLCAEYWLTHFISTSYNLVQIVLLLVFILRLGSLDVAGKFCDFREMH